MNAEEKIKAVLYSIAMKKDAGFDIAQEAMPKESDR